MIEGPAADDDRNNDEGADRLKRRSIPPSLFQLYNDKIFGIASSLNRDVFVKIT